MAVISWFAGIFYLPRLFVYHALSEDKISQERFKIMERKLYIGIMTPAAIVTLVTGFWLLSYGFWGNWMMIKLALVGAVVIYHFWCGQVIKRFAANQNKKSHIYYRVLNEVPVLLMVPIVIMVVVKPF